LTQGVGEGVWQWAVFDCPGGFFDVVGETDEFHADTVLFLVVAVAVDMEEDITSAGVAVLGFTDGADVDGMTEPGYEPGREGRGWFRGGRRGWFGGWLVCNGGEHPVIRFVGVAET
jgi:hypothetical protein